MSEANDLQHRFGVSQSVRIELGQGGLPKMVINGDLASAEIYLHGAHVTHFQPRGAHPVLFMSRSSWFDAQKPIRGGVPLVFPWFGVRSGHPQSPAHGFARIREWRIEACDERSDGSVRVVLNLSSDDSTLLHWPYAFALRLTVIIARSLDVTLEVRNLSQQVFQFEEALHTYLNVGDARQITVEGLDGAQYVDRMDNGQRKTQPAGPIHLTGETDRLYLNTTEAVVVHDSSLKRNIRVEKEGSHATVLWNPWIAKAKAMPDFGDDEWPHMVCVETANAMDCAIKLGAGCTHRMSAHISVG
jgi:D-hexose-6-phosphate mutarotase